MDLHDMARAWLDQDPDPVTRSELERLIGGRTEQGSDGPVRRPEVSPDGVLNGQTTEESRRVIARLVDALGKTTQHAPRLSGEPRTSRPRR